MKQKLMTISMMHGFAKIASLKKLMLAATIMLATVFAAQAATYTVTKTADTNDTICNADCSLREAFDVADGNGQADTINFNIPTTDAGCGGTASCTITLTSVIEPAADGGNLTTVSGTGANVITLSGGNTTRLFNIYGNAKISMSSLTIANGNGVSPSNSGGGSAILIAGVGSELTLDNVTLRNNSTAGDGGAINANDSSTLTITNSIIRNNSAGTGGGGIVNFGTTTVTNSTVSGNSTTNSGGGIYNNTTSTVNLTNSTVSGNSSGLNGGGIRNFGTANLISSTFSNNSAAGTGGGISNSGTTTLNNTIIANSLAGGDCVRPAGTINATYSLIEDNLTCVNGTNTNNLTGDPNLGALGNNGGSTETHALLTGSIAIDTGNSTLTTDQRGSMRPVNDPNSANGTGNLSDIGAFEVQAPTAASVTVSGRVLPPKGRGLLNAIVVLTDLNGSTRTARTSTFGYFRFDEVEVGQTYIFSVKSKRYLFIPQAVTVYEDLTELNFTPQ